MIDRNCDKKTMRRQDNDAMTRMVVAISALCEMEEGLTKERWEMQPGMHSRVKTAITHLSKAFDMLVDTVPLDQLVTVQKNLKHTRYRFGVMRGTVDEKFQGVYLEFKYLHPLIEAATNACLFCEKDKHGQKQCALRKAFDLLIVDKTEIREKIFSGCQYMGVACDGVKME